VVVVVLDRYVDALGCMGQICAGNEGNAMRACPDSDGSCGSYEGKRSDGRVVSAVDVLCSAGRDVLAPFDGEMYYWRPYGGLTEFRCADQGVRIEGTGQWQGYYALISSIELDFYGGSVKRGDKLGRAISLQCIESGVFADVAEHVQVQLFRRGKVVEPTSRLLADCMCTGQICETNPTNRLVSGAFKSDGRYNGVRGFDLRCAPVDEEEGDEEGDAAARAPVIYSPIDGKHIGRIRLNHDGGKYAGCENDGLFVVGRDRWEDYEVRIYNVRIRSDFEFSTHKMAINQHQPIGTRLRCQGAPDSIYLEMRYQGRVMDISDLLMATNCTKPAAPLIFF